MLVFPMERMALASNSSGQVSMDYPSPGVLMPTPGTVSFAFHERASWEKDDQSRFGYKYYTGT
jgi:hypothetical protein